MTHPSIPVAFNFCGHVVLTIFATRKCADEVSRYYRPMLVACCGTPDVIIECDWTEAGRYLFRARRSDQNGTALDGVRFQTAGMPKPAPWALASPPLPPFGLYPLANRLIALHAAALAAEDDSATLLVGDRGSGKSTFAVKMCREMNVRLLTDETTVIVRRTTVVLPFPQAMSFRDIGSRSDEKTLRSATEFVDVASRPALARRLIFLRRDEELGLTDLDKESAFRLLVNSHRDFGSSALEGLKTLRQLASECETSVLSWRSYDEIDAAGRILAGVVRAGEVTPRG